MLTKCVVKNTTTWIRS